MLYQILAIDIHVRKPTFLIRWTAKDLKGFFSKEVHDIPIILNKAIPIIQEQELLGR